MNPLRPLTRLVDTVLGRWLRRSDYSAMWNWQGRSLHNARLAVAGSADACELERSGAATAERLVRTLAITPDDVVLEIGCGVGRVGRALAPRCRQWIGTDVSSRMVALATRELASFSNVAFAVLSPSSLQPRTSCSVDVVYCTGVFMHLDEWDRYAYVEEAFRVLRPGGRLFVDNLNLLGTEGWRRFEELRRLPIDRRPPHISKSSTPQELEAYLARAGFTSVQITSEELWVSAWGTRPRT